MVPKQPLERVRAICLALPEATEKQAWGEPTFRVNDKIFAQYEDNHHGSGRVELWCKAPDGLQAALVARDPGRFFVPKYVGHKGWIGIRMEGAVDWDFVAELVRDSYRMTAPKRLLIRLDEDPGAAIPARARRRAPPRGRLSAR
ncbi:MAG: MmcQ/YjbR family DNA-binding protein [Chloroflexota bacterium]|nr:MmcQ/YjbR family DNA-binding protein [Chloroflexota bacterium]